MALPDVGFLQPFGLKSCETLATVVKAGNDSQPVKMYLAKLATESRGQSCAQDGAAHQAKGNGSDIQTVTNDAVPGSVRRAFSPRLRSLAVLVSGTRIFNVAHGFSGLLLRRSSFSGASPRTRNEFYLPIRISRPITRANAEETSMAR